MIRFRYFILCLFWSSCISVFWLNKVVFLVDAPFGLSAVFVLLMSLLTFSVAVR